MAMSELGILMNWACGRLLLQLSHIVVVGLCSRFDGSDARAVSHEANAHSDTESTCEQVPHIPRRKLFGIHQFIELLLTGGGLRSIPETACVLVKVLGLLRI